MEKITFENGLEIMLDALLHDRLTLLAGAGLSMAPPSCLPSAAQLATEAKQKYDATYGQTREPLAEKIEEQAEFFFQRGELETIYFNSLIGHHAFGSQPNAGHYAIADLLLVQCIQTAITTNVDTLIETAGEYLFGTIGAGVDGHQVAALPPNISPLLKIHGCRVRDWGNMVWAPGQLEVNPVRDRIANSATWLKTRLLNRDLLIVGYWTDWDYLNQVLSATLGTISPSRVVVVGPSDTETFEKKAPDLYQLGERATNLFAHVQASGSDFLDVLRCKFSQSYIRRIFHSGQADYHAQTGHDPEPAWLEPQVDDNDTLWRIRRDLEGCTPNVPATEKQPQAGETLLGLTLLQLQAGGAIQDGPYWLINHVRVRIIRAVNKFLHKVEGEFKHETAPATAPDLVIAVGAEGAPLPDNIARAGTDPTIIRGKKGRWMTRADALQELGI